MTTLTSSPVADVLRQLPADAERTQAAFRERMSAQTPEERAARPPDSRSTIFLAAALRDNGGGRLISTEYCAYVATESSGDVEVALRM